MDLFLATPQQVLKTVRANLVKGRNPPKSNGTAGTEADAYGGRKRYDAVTSNKLYWLSRAQSDRLHTAARAFRRESAQTVRKRAEPQYRVAPTTARSGAPADRKAVQGERIG